LSEADALVPLLAGASNFRAVQPYPATGGRRLRANTLFRSGELSRLSDADLDTIRGLDIRLVCDLRSRHEQSEFVSRWPDGTGHILLDLPDRSDRDEWSAGPEAIFQLIKSLPGQAGALRAMDMLYRRKPRAFAGHLKRLIDTIVAGGALPLLVHCHAGKDRTGFVVAMLLAAVGVSRADAIDDYMATARYFQVDSRALAAWAKRSFGEDVDPAATEPMAEARRAFIEAAFEEIDAQWGGTDSYLRDEVGIAGADQEALRDLLLV